VAVDRPGFEDKVFYVWFDAPIESIGATRGWADLDPHARDWKSWWHDVGDLTYTQFMAKDNVPFHTIMFPATLMGTREPWKLPDYIKAFNWLTDDGGKFSTSQRRGVFMSDDADFTWELFAGVVNKDLVGLPIDLLFRRITDDETTAWSAKFAGQESITAPPSRSAQRRRSQSHPR
jgi:methionyl-tRNA synthetase